MIKLVYLILPLLVPGTTFAFGGNFISDIMISNQLWWSLFLLIIPSLLPIPFIRFSRVRYFFMAIGTLVWSFLIMILWLLFFTLVGLLVDIRIFNPIILIILSLISIGLISIYVLKKRNLLPKLVRLWFVGIFYITNIVLWGIMFEYSGWLSAGMTPDTIRSNHILAWIMALIITLIPMILGIGKNVSWKINT